MKILYSSFFPLENKMFETGYYRNVHRRKYLVLFTTAHFIAKVGFLLCTTDQYLHNRAYKRM